MYIFFLYLHTVIVPLPAVCLRVLTSAILTGFLIFFVASPSPLHCFALLFLFNLGDFSLNYLERLLLLQMWFISWRIPAALDLLTTVARGHPSCHENFSHAAML